MDIPFHDRKDEIGDLAGALTVFRDNAADRERLAEAQRRAQADVQQRQIGALEPDVGDHLEPGWTEQEEAPAEG